MSEPERIELPKTDYMRGYERAANNVMATVKEVLGAQTARDVSGVKLTKNAKGETQVEVHAYEGATPESMKLIGDAARAEFDRQEGVTSLPADELRQLQMLASLGQVCQERHGGTLMNEGLTTGQPQL